MAQILAGCGYVIPGTNNVTDAITKKKAVDALKSFKIRQFATDANTVVEEWELKNAFITNVDWGELNYESDDLTNCTITVRYDWAELKTGDGSGTVGGAEDANIGMGTFFEPKAE